MKTKQEVLETPDVQMIALDRIHPSPLNPRKRFDEEAITELAESVAEHGLLQPITVAPWVDGYVIVAGERRWRACSQLQLATVPCIIRPVGTDKEHLELALIENLQRTDIDPIEEAAGYRALMDMGLKQREIAERVHRQQPAVAKAIGLLDLPEDVQELISQGKLTPSHGVWLQSLSAFPEICSLAAAHAVRAQTTVRDMDRTLNRDYYGIGHEIVKKGLAVELPSPHAAEDTFNVRDTCMHGACPHKACRGLLCLKPDHYKELKQAAATAPRSRSASSTGSTICPTATPPAARSAGRRESAPVWPPGKRSSRSACHHRRPKSQQATSGTVSPPRLSSPPKASARWSAGGVGACSISGRTAPATGTRWSTRARRRRSFMATRRRGGAGKHGRWWRICTMRTWRMLRGLMSTLPTTRRARASTRVCGREE